MILSPVWSCPLSLSLSCRSALPIFQQPSAFFVPSQSGMLQWSWPSLPSLAHHDHRIAAAAGAAAHFPGHSIPKKRRLRRPLQESNLWSPPFLPSSPPSPPSFPNPIYLGSPIGLPIPTYLHLFFYPILGSLTSYILVDISMKPKMWLPKPPDSKAVPPFPLRLCRAPRAPFGQVKLRKGGGRRRRRRHNRWHLLSSAWSRARPQEVAWSRVRVRFLK